MSEPHSDLNSESPHESHSEQVSAPSVHESDAVHECVSADPTSEVAASTSFWSRNRWLVPVLPLVVYLLCGLLEPSRTPPESGWLSTFAIPFDYYPAYYFFRMSVTLFALLLVIPSIRDHVAGDWSSFHWHGMSLLLGVIGAVVWVGLCQIPWNAWCVQIATSFGQGDSVRWLLGSSARVGFNPWSDLAATPGTLSLFTFLAVRFAGLAILVPFSEELFLRGFLLRFVQQEKWWAVPVGTLTRSAIAVLLIYAVVTHPSEWMAAIIWFSAVSWWTARTHNLWYAVQIHMMTNLGLGLWILWSRQWWLW